MSEFRDLAQAFLAHQRLAVVGVSREGGAHTGNAIYQALQKGGYQVFPVNEQAEEIEGAPCYHHVYEIPGGVEGVVIVTRPEAALEVVKDCEQAGVKSVWMHYNPLFGAGSSSSNPEAAAYGREHGMQVIDLACPLMFMDTAHKCMRVVLEWMGKVPR
jgi:hypothetical protein